MIRVVTSREVHNSLRRDNVKQHVKILSVFDSYNVDYQPKSEGGSFRCAFHGEDIRPSGMYYLDTNDCYCFKCNQSWDVIGFVMESDGLSFMAAISKLEKEFSVPHLDIKLDEVLLEEKEKNLITQESVNAVIKFSCHHLVSMRDTLPMKFYLAMFFILDNLVDDLSKGMGPVTAYELVMKVRAKIRKHDASIFETAET